MMTELWTSETLAEVTLGTATQAFSAGGVSIDTRTIKPGDLFVAIRGDSMDGHAFVVDALKRGAAAALVSHMPEGVAKNAPLLMTANTQRALEDMGRAARTRFDGEVVAVTGSVGKTTAKELLTLALGAIGPTHASKGSLNNHWGVPLTLAQMPPEARYAVIEEGMNHYGELRALNAMVRPHIALITAIAAAHIEFFGSLEAISDAKSEIFESLLPGGSAVLPIDCPQYERLRRRAVRAGVTSILTFGADGDAQLVSYTEEEEACRAEVDICGIPVKFRLNAPGRHNAVEAMAALACVAVLGGDVRNAAAALSEFTPLKGRGARIEIGDVTVIDEGYNANPASMAAALSLLKTAPKRKIAVLGDMLEMGESAPKLHAGLLDSVVGSGADLVFLCGSEMQALWEKLPAAMRGGYTRSSAELAPLVAAALGSEDTVLIKGSNGMKMSKITTAIKEARA